MKSRSLLTQILAVNILLIGGTVILTMVAVYAQVGSVVRGREATVVGAAVVATLLGNWLVLRTRFKPLDELISAMESVDLVGRKRERSRGARRADSSEVRRLGVAFDRMMSRLEAQRREAGRARQWASCCSTTRTPARRSARASLERRAKAATG